LRVNVIIKPNETLLCFRSVGTQGPGRQIDGGASQGFGRSVETPVVNLYERLGQVNVRNLTSLGNFHLLLRESLVLRKSWVLSVK
jgi:hypothetical protein